MRISVGSCRTLREDREGAVLVIFALALVVLIGFAGLGAEVGLWYIAKRGAQGAADAAAYSAAVDYHAGDISYIAETAKAIAAQYGYVDGSDGVTIAVNRPPRSGTYHTNSDAVEVVIDAPQRLLFSKLFLPAMTVSARAVALAAGTGSAFSSNPAPAPSSPNSCLVRIGRDAEQEMPDCGMSAGSGGNLSQAMRCLAWIKQHLDITGATGLYIRCGSAAVAPVVGVPAKLVE